MSVSQDTSAPAADPRSRDKRRLRKTKTPGVYRRVDGEGATVGYVAVIEVAGKQRKRSARTYEEARRIKRGSESDRDRGVLQPNTAITFLQYLDEWVERYRGQGRGFRENTRDEYRRLIHCHARHYFSKRLKLTDVTTYELARFVDWLRDEDEQGKRIADSTIANVMMPLRSALATATREGLIRHNPSRGLVLPREPEQNHEDDEETVKVFSREQLSALLAMAPEPHRLLFEVLAGCGLRISEAIGLQRLHVLLDEPPPEICVRRALVKGRIGPPKSKYGRRDVPLTPRLARKLREHLGADAEDSAALAFVNEAGGPIDPNNLRRRILKPLVQEVGAPWAGFHTFRHTFASMHLSNGTNIVQLSRVLGHHSPAFTLSRYTHLLPGEAVPALEVQGSPGLGGHRRALHFPAS
ncbi:MAG TPA: tyrosine-type recombinase/integrase [Solirubrobacterales bacterium]|nr:tyrosine-type recombinase/integrase [Solirubrobacterales bacterium]